MERVQQDDYSLLAKRDATLFKGWTADDPNIEKSTRHDRRWDRILTKDTVRRDACDGQRPTPAERRSPQNRARAAGTRGGGLSQALTRMTKDWGRRLVRVAVRPHQREHTAAHVHRPVQPEAGRAARRIQRRQAATGANFRRIIDFADLDKTMATNAPGESGQPESPDYANARQKLADGVYFNLPFTRPAVNSSAQADPSLNETV